MCGGGRGEILRATATEEDLRGTQKERKIKKGCSPGNDVPMCVKNSVYTRKAVSSIFAVQSEDIVLHEVMISRPELNRHISYVYKQLQQPIVGVNCEAQIPEVCKWQFASSAANCRAAADLDEMYIHILNGNIKPNIQTDSLQLPFVWLLNSGHRNQLSISKTQPPSFC